MGEFFPNQYWGMDIWKHQELPIIESHDFNFFRCLEFNDGYYGKTVSELHSGNLRLSRKDNRYSNLFPGQKLSYWADSPQTARAEIKKWGSGNNILTFWAYDDGSSFIPTIYPAENIRIIDGVHFGFDKILKKVEYSLDKSNTVFGCYMCQGKMPMSVRQRYEEMKKQPIHLPNLDALIENFDNALSHPDADDLERLKQAVK